MYSIYQVTTLAQARHRDFLAQAEQQRLVREVRQLNMAARRAARSAAAAPSAPADPSAPAARTGWLNAFRLRPQAHA